MQANRDFIPISFSGDKICCINSAAYALSSIVWWIPVFTYREPIDANVPALVVIRIKVV